MINILSISEMLTSNKYSPPQYILSSLILINSETYSFEALEIVVNEALLLEILRAYDTDKSKEHIDL